MKPYDSIIARAHKLLALSVNIAAAPGEAENAKKLFAEHCDRYNITMDDLNAEARAWRGFQVVCRDKETFPPRRDMQLFNLARVCMAYVCGDINRPYRRIKSEYEMETRGMIPVKFLQCYEIEAKVTEREYFDWKDCFSHYRDDFMEEVRERRADVRNAQTRLKFAWAAFCEVNDIVPPLPPVDGPASPKAALDGIIAKMGIKKKEPWQAGRKLQ